MSSERGLRRTLVTLGVAVGLAHAGAQAADTKVSEELAVTPYRPTVSSPAALPVAGHVEFETGYERRNEDDGGTRQGLGYLFKYAFNSNVGILLGGEAWARHETAAEVLNGSGDSFIALKVKLPVGDETKAFGFEPCLSGCHTHPLPVVC